MVSAEQHREEKARLIARYAWRLGWSPDQLAQLVRELPHASRSRRVPTLSKFARDAYAAAGQDDVRVPSSPLSSTWRRAIAKLEQMANRERIGLDVPARDLTERSTDWFAETEPVGPKGWAQVVALGPVDPPEQCEKCEGPAVLLTVDGWICAAHPPVEGDWGWRLDFTPKPCSRPLRCYCGRHEPGPPTPGVETVIDQQAIASGKRRSTPEQFRTAREAIERRRSA